MAIDRVRRRDFLRVAAGSGVVLPGLIAACSAPAPASPTAAPAKPVATNAAPPNTGATPNAGATPAAAAKPSGVLPTYVALQNGPKPDYASAGQQYEDGWDNYPM